MKRCFLFGLAVSLLTQPGFAAVPVHRTCQIRSTTFEGWAAEELSNQWLQLTIVKQLGGRLRIDWGNPSARNYVVQYWSGEKDPLANPTAGAWIALGIVTDGRGGLETLKFTPPPAPLRYMRIWMTQSSNTTSTHDPQKPDEPTDPRSSVGYAIRELYAGISIGDGEFADLIKHAPDGGQTVVHASSVDPWHSAADLSLQAGDQTGMDLFYTSGITNHLPAMIPIAMLYGIPEDAAAQIAYVEKRGYPNSYVEMGEEPDGQKMRRKTTALSTCSLPLPCTRWTRS
jgi:hypothetical protein